MGASVVPHWVASEGASRTPQGGVQWTMAESLCVPQEGVRGVVQAFRSFWGFSRVPGGVQRVPHVRGSGLVQGGVPREVHQPGENGPQ